MTANTSEDHHERLARVLRQMPYSEQVTALRAMDDEHWARYGKLASAHGDLLSEHAAQGKTLGRLYRLIDVLRDLPGGQKLLHQAQERLDADAAFGGEHD